MSAMVVVDVCRGLGGPEYPAGGCVVEEENTTH
jgi:hypothetical protein